MTQIGAILTSGLGADVKFIITLGYIANITTPSDDGFYFILYG